jgi:glycosyltransferase involved in cell wall biosynthesis
MPDGPLVTVFTATKDIGAEIDTAYRSLLGQTYDRWEWVVVDDSERADTGERIEALAGAPASKGRIRLYRQFPPSGSIGATKAAAGALSRGEVLVELDHDDELTAEALEVVAATFLAHPDVDFVYSDWVDVSDGPNAEPLLYPAGWGFGLGAYATEIVARRRVPVALAPPMTWETIRHIISAPNHLRAWRRDFYRRIGGHDHTLHVADDYELVVRTFLQGTMARLPRPLYVQHHSPDQSNASRVRNADIQELVGREATRYAHALDRRCTSLGLTPSEQPFSWTDSRPVPAASLVIDVVGEAAGDAGMPLVSVVVPTWRRAASLERALQSVLLQTYDNLEVLVVGDGCEVVDEVVAGTDDARVRHWNLPEHHGDSGASPRNYALKAMARGLLIAYLDDDNEWEPEHLSSLVSLLAGAPEATFAFSSFQIDGEPITCRRPRRYQIDTSALLHKRFLVERFGYWRPPDVAGYAHDWELVARWEGEPWVASLLPTVRYSLHGPGREEVFDLLRDVAEEERRVAAASGSG